MINKSLKDIGNYVDFSSEFGMNLHFGRKSELIEFLNDLFAGEKVIEELIYLKEVPGVTSEVGRRTIFNLHCTETNGEQFVIEMQQVYAKDDAREDPLGSRFSKVYSIDGIGCRKGDLPKVHCRYAIALQDFAMEQEYGNGDAKVYLLGKIMPDELALRKDGDDLNPFPDSWGKDGVSLRFEVEQLGTLSEEGFVRHQVQVRTKRLGLRVDPLGSRAEYLSCFKEAFEAGFRKGYHEEAVRIALRMKKMGFEHSQITEVVWLFNEKMEQVSHSY